jgi:adenylylsulfate kinase-like enzyme
MGIIVITAFISPYKADRNRIRKILKNKFHEIYVKTDIETCKKRDPKGLYKKALKGQIQNLTGIDAPYEEPENPELIIDTKEESVEESLEKLQEYVIKKFLSTNYSS